MQVNAKARYVRYSPYKLRPLADVVRGKNVKYAIQWLVTSGLKRSEPIKKLIESAAANANQLHGADKEQLVVKEIRIDQGPMYRYFKPGAMGRANIYRRRFSHMSVIVESVSDMKR